MTEETLFELALRTPFAERAALLERACEGRPDLRQRLQRLLAANEASDAVIDQAPEIAANVRAANAGFAATKSVSSTPEAIGAVLGRFTLEQMLGEGGMGSVWVAKQSEPIKRRVALKLIKTGMDSRSVLRRFEAERQALAVMDHPNIARVFDGGLLPDGRPFFAMELVNGLPIVRFCDETRLGTRARLEIFVKVCQAVQHAHQKGIIHRDLKPANILVTLIDGRPEPKVIDFGVAKAMGGKLSDRAETTQFGAVVGTLEYMAPEQAGFSGTDIDTRADVYALGVILYELLTGLRPFDSQRLRLAALDEVIRIIREEEPSKPSTRLSSSASLPSLAAERRTEPGRLLGSIRGDLDWIAMKCLEKDRNRRYETANGLAADIMRHLSDEPVLATPPSSSDRLRKFWRRNKLAMTSGMAIAASLVLGMAVSVWQAVRADRETRRTLAALEELRATAPAFAEQARSLAAKEQFAEAIEKLDYAAKLRPDQAEFLVAKGDLLQCQFRLKEAGDAYQEALRLKSDDPRAKEGAALCTELSEAPLGADGKLTRESLGKLHRAMLKQQRPAAEIMPVARLLGSANELLVAYWLERLKGLPISGDKPLAKRIKVREDGMLSLDLSDTKVADLSPLAGAPLAVLSLARDSEAIAIDPIRGMALVSLDLSDTKVSNLSPLVDMKSLTSLILDNAPSADLAPLRGLRLKRLSLSGCIAISDLSPIRGAPIEALSLRDTRVADLSPLVGAPLKSIDLTNVPALDFTPLAGLPLEHLYFQSNRVADLRFVRKMPLRELVLWGCLDARGYEALTDLKSLELLLLPRNYRDLPAKDLESIAKLRSLPKLRQLGAQITDKMTFGATGPKEKFWKDWDEYESRFGGLIRAGLKYQWELQEDGSYSLTVIDQSISDLSFLKSFKGAALHRLWLSGNRISDLTPLVGLPIRRLGLYGNPIKDLGPLSGLPLEELSLDKTTVSNLDPLAGSKLKRLLLHDCENSVDVAPLAKITTLEDLTLPLKARNIERLRSLQNLKRIGFGMQESAPFAPTTTAAEFWGEFDRLQPLGKLAEQGVKIKRLRRLRDGLWDLDLSESSLTDLSILKGAPLAELWLADTEVSDLSPLQGMKLRKLHLFHTRVTDLSPLKGMPLELINLVSTAVSDLSPLAGMPLEEIKLDDCKELTDLDPLKQCPSLRTVTLPRGAKDFDFLRAFPKLERLSYDEDPNNGWRPTTTAVEFWRQLNGEKTVADALGASGLVAKQVRSLGDGKWHVDLERSGVTDLTPLHGLPIKSLRVGNNEIVDLGPLRGMPLTELWLFSTKVVDVSPLAGMALEHLNLNSTGVADLTPLRKMPMVVLRLTRCNSLVDVETLKEMTNLKELTLPPAATEIDFLRSFKKLERLSYSEEPGSGRPTMSAAEFWKDLPRIKPLLILRAEAMKQLGGEAVLEMEVQSSAVSAAGNVYLNSGPDYKKVENVAVQIRASVAEAFKAKLGVQNPAEYFRGKRIRVAGKAVLYNGSPSIVVDSVDKVAALDKGDSKSGRPLEPPKKSAGKKAESAN